MKPAEVYSLTPRELTILMRAEQERRYDDYERMTTGALMNRQAYHAKSLKPSDLFKRPLDTELAKKKAEELIEKTRHTSEWLSQFTIGNKRKSTE